MRFLTTFPLLSIALTTKVAAQSSSAALPLAKAVTNNPAGVVYKATLPEEAFFKAAYPEGGNVQGEITAVASPDQSGVMFKVKFSNLPKTGGPFTYHLHVAPVPENGNCTATLAHLDPTVRGEEPPCDPSKPASCQVGDLSGKYGKIPEGEESFEVLYTDPYASTLEGIGAFFGNRSFVFHYTNKTRITCASFVSVASPTHPAEESGCTETHAPPAASSVSAAPSSIVSISPSSNGTVPTTVQTAAPSQTSVVTAGGSATKTGGVSAMLLAAAIMFML